MRASALPRDLAADLSVCLQFFSRLPAPAVGDPAQRPPFGRAIRMLPVAGLLIGAGPAAVLALGGAAGLPPVLCVLVAGAASVLVTGGLHEDGLADTADGFGGGVTRERKLAIMRDSRIGTYGVLAIALALALRIAALAALLPRVGLSATVLAMLGAAAVSRALALLPLATLSPARLDGLGHGAGPPEPTPLAICFGSAAVLGFALPAIAGIDPLHDLLACMAAAAAAATMTRLALRQIGGHTGDVGGACQQLAEIAYLIGLLAFGGAPPGLS